jgi:S-adenosylmethionine/arginine decarboxylase-like enzyme
MVHKAYYLESHLLKSWPTLTSLTYAYGHYTRIILILIFESTLCVLTFRPSSRTDPSRCPSLRICCSWDSSPHMASRFLLRRCTSSRLRSSCGQRGRTHSEERSSRNIVREKESRHSTVLCDISDNVS